MSNPGPLSLIQSKIAESPRDVPMGHLISSIADRSSTTTPEPSCSEEAVPVATALTFAMFVAPTAAPLLAKNAATIRSARGRGRVSTREAGKCAPGATEAASVSRYS